VSERALKERLGRKGEAEAPPAAEVAVPEPLVAAGRELIACLVADRVTAAAVRGAVPAELYPTEPLRRIAEAAYGLLDRLGEVAGRELTGALGDPALASLAASILAGELDPGQVPGRAAAAREALERAAARSESKDIRARLKEAQGPEQDALLRQLMDKRKKRPTDHGLLPGR
jgi:hypothetical protein